MFPGCVAAEVRRTGQVVGEEHDDENEGDAPEEEDKPESQQGDDGEETGEPPAPVLPPQHPHNITELLLAHLETPTHRSY